MKFGISRLRCRICCRWCSLSCWLWWLWLCCLQKRSIIIIWCKPDVEIGWHSLTWWLSGEITGTATTRIDRPRSIPICVFAIDCNHRSRRIRLAILYDLCRFIIIESAILCMDLGIAAADDCSCLIIPRRCRVEFAGCFLHLGSTWPYWDSRGIDHWVGRIPECRHHTMTVEGCGAPLSAYPFVM